MFMTSRLKHQYKWIVLRRNSAHTYGIYKYVNFELTTSTLYEAQTQYVTVTPNKSNAKNQSDGQQAR